MKILATKHELAFASINIYDIDANEDKVTAGWNNDKPRRYNLYYTDKGVYFNFAGHRQYLSEFIRLYE